MASQGSDPPAVPPAHAIALDPARSWVERAAAIEALHALDPTRYAWAALAAEIGPEGLPRRVLDLGGGVEMTLVFIGPGTFTMGSPETEPGRFNYEGPQRRISIERGFWLGATEVTQAQYARVTGADPSRFRGDPQRPVESVGWSEAKAFCAALSERFGIDADLPSEAQWEYACRAGTTTAYAFGDDPERLGEHAWFEVNAGRGTHPVATKPANAWGLHDLHGNVWEWCEDPWQPSLEGIPADGSPRRGDAGDRVLRGGSWKANPRGWRSASRYWGSPTTRYFTNGFRVRIGAGSSPVTP